MTGIPPTPVTTVSATPTTVPDAPVTTVLPAQVNMDPVEPAPELLIPELVAELPMGQPGEDSQLGGLYIANMQVHNNGTNVSLCTLDLEAHEYLKFILMKG